MRKITYVFVLIPTIFIILLWTCAPQICSLIFPNYLEIDPFSAISSLFSGLAFLALIVTIAIQVQSLKEQRADFQKMMRARSLNTLIANHQWVARTLESSPIRSEKIGLTTQDIADNPAKYYKELMQLVDEESIKRKD